MTDISKILPPQDFNAECTVLKELILYPQNLVVPMNSLTEEAFFNEKNRNIFRTIKTMYDNHEVADLVTMYDKVDVEHFNKYIMPKDVTYTPELVDSHCAQLRSVLLRRKAFFAAMKMLQKSNDAFATEDEILNLPNVLSDEFSKSLSKNNTQSIQEAFAEIDKDMHSGAQKRVSTSFPRLDKLTYGGFSEGQLIVLAARPSVGKTAVMLQMARCAAGNKIPTLALSLEMTNKELAQRIIFSTGFVNAIEMAKGNYDWPKFDLAYSKHSHDTLYLDDTVHSIDDVCSSITLNHIQGKCDIVFIDYLQLMSDTSASSSLYQQVSGITKRLKQLAKTLRIPVVLLAQLNRNSVSQGRSPQLHDLRDSGSIEQDADIVLMLERASEEGMLPTTNQVTMWVRKNRGGEGSDIQIKLEATNGYTIFNEIG